MLKVSPTRQERLLISLMSILYFYFQINSSYCSFNHHFSACCYLHFIYYRLVYKYSFCPSISPAYYGDPQTFYPAPPGCEMSNLSYLNVNIIDCHNILDIYGSQSAHCGHFDNPCDFFSI